MSEPRISYLFSSPGHTPVAVGPALRYRKDVARVGRFLANDPTTGKRVPLDIDTARMDRWINNFSRYVANGNQVKLTVDHLPSGSADAVRGDVLALFRARRQGEELIPDPAGDTLGIDLDAADADAETLIKRCGQVSIEVEHEVEDGPGNRYDEIISAVTVCQKPIVTGQAPFRRIAASREAGDGDTANRIVLHFAADPPAKQPPDPTEPPAMDIKLSTAALAALVGLGLIPSATAKPEEVVTSLEGLKDRKITDASTLDKATQFDAVSQERDTLKGQVTELQKGKTPEVDVDVLEESAGNKQEKLDNLVTAGKITPAAAKIAASRFIGEPGKRKVLCLSRKAATHAGLQNPMFDDLLEVLSANNPVELNKQHVAGQTVHASRAPVHGGADDEKELDELEKRTRERAGGKA